jgi:indole-3-glycerol phosphate synthase
VDIVLAMDQANLRAFLDMAKQMNMQPVAPVSTEDLLNQGVSVIETFS